MSTVGVVSVAVGSLFLCLRASVLVAPVATLRWFKATIGTNGPIRTLGACLLTVGVTMAWAGATQDSTLAFFLSVAGWAFVGISAVAVLVPGACRAYVHTIHPTDVGASLSLWRFGGLKGVVVSGLLIYFGLLAL